MKKSTFSLTTLFFIKLIFTNIKYFYFKLKFKKKLIFRIYKDLKIFLEFTVKLNLNLK